MTKEEVISQMKEFVLDEDNKIPLHKINIENYVMKNMDVTMEEFYETYGKEEEVIELLKEMKLREEQGLKQALLTSMVNGAKFVLENEFNWKDGNKFTKDISNETLQIEFVNAKGKEND